MQYEGGRLLGARLPQSASFMSAFRALFVFRLNVIWPEDRAAVLGP